MPLAIVGNNFVIAWEERATMAFVLQVQRTCIDRNISLLGIQKLFEDADTHGSGYLDYLEFRVFCEELRPRVHPLLESAGVILHQPSP